MKVSLKTKTVSNLLYNLKKGKISLEHPLQRKTGQWSRKAQSELIDSLLREYIVPPLCFHVEEVTYDIDGVSAFIYHRRLYEESICSVETLRTDYHRWTGTYYCRKKI